MTSRALLLLVVSTLASFSTRPERAVAEEEPPLPKTAENTLHRAATYYRERVAAHGGYVYQVSLDFQQRWGEGKATADQIWVQPPGTPSVGLAFLKAYEATRDSYYLDAARDAAEALVYGQLASGGWTNSVDFNPRGDRVAQYRNGKGRGKNNSTLDDDITQSAIRFLMHFDKTVQFQPGPIHDSVKAALDALLAAQFPNGGFPQVWTGPVKPRPIVAANYPEYDWRTEGKVRNYWDMYTLNDGLAGTVSATLIDADAIYHDPRYRSALVRLGDFLLLAQMPDPQPAWAQQYNERMQPIWARRFEPPAVTGGESQDAMETLLRIHRATGDAKYLAPIPRALDYLKRSRLADGRLARYYELQSNRPLYMNRTGEDYHLTYDDSNLPAHYGWKVASRLDAIEREYLAARNGHPLPKTSKGARDLETQVRTLAKSLDSEGRWVSTYDGDRLVGQPKFPPGFRYLASDVFCRNVEILSTYLKSVREP